MVFDGSVDAGLLAPPRGTGPGFGRKPHTAPERGMVLVIVLWVSFGIVSIALYFAHSMSFELRAADNRLAGLEADQAIDGAARYVTHILANLETNGWAPDFRKYQEEAVPVGEATFWFLGRDPQPATPNQPTFRLVDEAAKLNLNTATLEMLELLPRMTPEFAAAIIDWRDADSEVTTGGAEDETYLRRNPAYHCKNAPFESINELHLVAGSDPEILLGEDTNRNGFLDLNENDGTVSVPFDNHDGRVDPGILEYVTVYSREPNTRSDGTPRFNVSTTAGRTQLTPLLQEKFGPQQATQILQRASAGGPIRSVLDFFVRSRMSVDQFAQISGDITTGTASFLEGLVNINDASEAVLACLPGIGLEKASSVVAYRQSNPDRLGSVAWLVEAVGEAGARQAGARVTVRSYQFIADIAAVGHHGRGYRRAEFVFDTMDGTPKVLHRRDLSQLGWALGREVRQNLPLLAQRTR